jgi:hypothetical protein
VYHRNYRQHYSPILTDVNGYFKLNENRLLATTREFEDKQKKKKKGRRGVWFVLLDVAEFVVNPWIECP